MIERILLAVDDSTASMTAARAAVELAAPLGAQILAVSVLADHVVGEHLTAVLTRPATVKQRRAQAGQTVLRHVVRLGAQCGVPVETVLLDGEPATGILEQAASLAADLIVLGHTNRHGAGRPYVGAPTQHVLEFAAVPVLVVPTAAADTA
jgi:nucleotide-binding universal stress UspA family protein